MIRGGVMNVYYSREQRKIYLTLETCHNAGAEPSLLKGIVAMFRRYYTG